MTVLVRFGAGFTNITWPRIDSAGKSGDGQRGNHWSRCLDQELCNPEFHQMARSDIRLAQHHLPDYLLESNWLEYYEQIYKMAGNTEIITCVF